MSMAPPPQGAGKGWLWGALLAALAIGGVIFGLSASGLLQFGARETPPVAQAGATMPPPLLQARSRDAQAVTQAPAPERTEMPADVRAWLEHLRKIEERRVALSEDHLSKMFVTMARMQGAGAMEMLQSLMNPEGDFEPKPPSQDFVEELRPLKEEWTKLVTDFGAMPPPAECVPIRNEYDMALRETGGMIGDLVNVLSQPIETKEQQNPAVGTLMKWKGKSAQRIDEPAKRADQGVGDICRKYETAKWFSIVGDVGGGGMLTKGLGF